MHFAEPKLEKPKHSWELEAYAGEIVTDNQREAFNAAMSTTNRVHESDGWQILELISHLERSSGIVEYNYGNLTEVFERSRDLTPYSWDEVQDLDKEFLAEMSNFVVSAKSRENLTRDIILPSLEKYHVISSVTKQYEEKVEELNLDLPGYFFTSLRNLLVHEGVPETVIILGQIEDEEDHLTIQKKMLLESDNVSAQARGYMDAWDEYINLEEASKSYFDSAKELYNWFLDFVGETYDDEFNKSRHLEDQARISQEVFFNRIDQGFMTIEWN